MSGKIKVIVCYFIMMQWILVSGINRSVRAEELQLYARSAVLMDGSSGRILFGKNENTPLPMASTTKIMTCILALESGREEEFCKVSANAAAQPKVKLGMREGEEYRMKDLLYSLMLESHNDTAVCIAEHLAESTEKFAQEMNRKAEQIGCRDTYFITPNGLDAETEEGKHHTTAADLARILRYCITASPKAEQFLDITRTDSYTVTDKENIRSVCCINHNAFLHMMEGALTGKTGFTGEAGYCYTGALRKDGKTLIAALLACGWPNHKRYKWEDMKKLMELGLRQYEKRTVGTETIQLPVLKTEGGEMPFAELKIVNRRTSEVLMKPEEKTQYEIHLPESVRAPLDAGTKVGCVLWKLEKKVYAEADIVTVNSIAQTDYLYWLHKIYCIFLVK